MVVVVVVWYVPRPRVQALVLLGKTGECHKLIRLVKDWWPNNWESAQSVVAINICCPLWLGQIWGLLVASLPPRGISPCVGPCSCLRDVTHTRSCACMNAPLGNSLVLVLRYREAPYWLSPHLEPIISRQALRKHSGCNVPLTRHIWKDFLWAGGTWIIRKSFSSCMRWTFAAV